MSQSKFTLTMAVVAGLAVATSCGSHGIDQCASGDLDCFLAHLSVTQGSAPVPLRTIDSSLLSKPVTPTPAAPFLWAVGHGAPTASPPTTGVAGWDGSQWTQYPNVAPSSRLDAVWTFATDDAWAGGYKNALAHWNGTAWSLVSTGGALAGGGFDSIIDLWGTAQSNLWAVTASGSVAHYTGTWSAFTPLTTGGGTLAAIWGPGPSDVWTVGSGGTAFHYDGTAWSPATLPTGGLALSAIWGAAANDVWAAASGGSSNSGLLVHWNGTAWSKDIAASNAVAGIYNGLFLWGSGPHDIWESGYNIGGSILAHYDGTSWTVQPPFVIGTNYLLQGGSLWGRSKNDAWMVGYDFRHWDGTAWTKIAGPGSSYSSVRGVVLPSGGGAGTPPSITNQPPPMTFAGPAQVATTVGWSDSNGCQPAFCFRLCGAPLQCSASARCSGIVADGRLAGSTILTLGYTAEPAAGSVNFTLEIAPVSSRNCADPIALLAGGTPGALVGGSAGIVQTVAPPTSSTGGSIVGVWKASGTTTQGTATTVATTTYTFNSDGSDAYNSTTRTTYSDGTPSASSSCAATGTYTTTGSSITIVTPSPPASCGVITSPYTTTWNVSGNTLTFGGDSGTYLKQ